MVRFPFFFQLYLPYVNHPISTFREYVDSLQNITSLYSDKGLIILMGDINIYMPTTCFRDKPDDRSIYSNTFLQQNNLISVNTLDSCTGAKSTSVTVDMNR